ncbi:hypothetical protein [Klebsiella variicola]|uniref:hypothetical protein n=1 Tax=Klebsiella TaxID=570 RepID=UPI000F54A333|nr:hypothetical protein [Klebsiella variicola]ELN4236126.1 hypothetical protein [Klebsiella variicola]ELQ4153873.1 hypothetical protein [Klebsiella variicola]EMC8477040.1 hypothetical protein [Klebsiella variicola]MBZ7036516.1 hypothetical protein [Klebsiella variicola]MCR3895942.1 hypothetical protein [Klebsiella variicola]
MKTFNQLKFLIDFCQTDAFFLKHLNRLQIAGVIYLDEPASALAPFGRQVSGGYVGSHHNAWHR